MTAIAQAKAPLTGIRGWLVWLGLGLILSPIRVIYQMVKYYTNENNLAIFQTYPIMMTGELFLNLLWLTAVFYIPAVFFREKRIFKKAFTIVALANMPLVFLNYLWVSAISGLPLATLIGQPESAQQIGSAIGYLIASTPWIAYVWRSRRVANTFVN